MQLFAGRRNIENLDEMQSPTAGLPQAREELGVTYCQVL